VLKTIMRQLLTVLLLAIAASACRGADSAGLPTGSPAPDFSLPGADGKTYALRDFANSPVLVVLFTGTRRIATRASRSLL
jgi:hypothetical protein